MSNSKAKSSETTIDSDEYVDVELTTFKNDEKTKQDEYDDGAEYFKLCVEQGRLSETLYKMAFGDENSK